MTKDEYIEMLIANHDGPTVRRKDTGEFTNKAVSDRSVANKESLGDPVSGRMIVGRSVIYPVRRYAEYIAAHYFKG